MQDDVHIFLTPNVHRARDYQWTLWLLSQSKKACPDYGLVLDDIHNFSTSQRRDPYPAVLILIRGNMFDIPTDERQSVGLSNFPGIRNNMVIFVLIQGYLFRVRTRVRQLFSENGLQSVFNV